MEKLSNVAYSGLNKKAVLLIGGGITIAISSIIVCTLFTNNGVSQSQPQIKQQMSKDTNQPADVSIVVNNVLTLPAVESKIKLVMPPNPNDTSRLVGMGNPQEVTTTRKISDKPEMFTSNDAMPINDDKNSITGTNTSVGVGTLDSQYKAQRSPYTIFAGSYIPAQMVNGINSDLNGMVIAQVRSDVYDTTQGKYLLIPQGSRLVGTYNHEVAYGQNRLMVGWNRVIFPNGGSFLLHGQPGTDLQGFSGFSDDVDNHYMKIFGSAFLMGAIFGGVSLAAGNQNTNPYQLSAGATMANQVGAQMAQAGIQVINKGLNISPTIIIHEGYQFNIAMTADLVLKPYVYKSIDNQ
jgi:type IV secretory pathway VirB10-like protein